MIYLILCSAIFISYNLFQVNTFAGIGFVFLFILCAYNFSLFSSIAKFFIEMDSTSKGLMKDLDQEIKKEKFYSRFN